MIKHKRVIIFLIGFNYFHCENLCLMIVFIFCCFNASNPLPILSNVLLEAEDGSLRLTTTDLDVGVTGSVKAKVGKSGSTTLPARRLAGIVRELPADEISIEVGYFFVKVYYEQEIYSPYDYMGNRLGVSVKRLATIIFSINLED